MPLPLAVVAPIALRYGGVALASWAVARGVNTIRNATAEGARSQAAEDALDQTPEGATLRREADQGNATARMKRVLRWKDGSGVEIDISALARIRLRRL